MASNAPSTNAPPKRIPKAARVKNKAPAPVQITAEQLLREAKERLLEHIPAPPKQKVADAEELAELHLKKRKDYEDQLRKNRTGVANWIKYARWEENQKEFQRARSIFERALEMDHRCVPLWMKYVEMEMRNKQLNHARNIFDRVVLILPRVSQFWYKYVYMEEAVGNVAGARQVFERWMHWEPEEQAWLSFIKMELRYKEVDRARSIYERFVQVHCNPNNWIKFAKFEMINGSSQNARVVYEKAVEFFGEHEINVKLMVAFAKFEEGAREIERARVIYKYAMERTSKVSASILADEYAKFEKRHGNREGVENVILQKRRELYIKELDENPYKYDTWFDLIALLQSDCATNKEFVIIRETFEKAIANIPPLQEKHAWRRYIYLWIYYAVFEELTTRDIERTRKVFNACLKVIPHSQFTFAKIWIMFSQFELRCGDLEAARRIMGNAIGRCQKDKLFREYISMELQLREFDRCRRLYEKYIEFNPSSYIVWIKYSEMENILGNIERARAIFEIGIKQSVLNMPEMLWKAYIDFEIQQGEMENVKALYERLLEKSQHAKVWISYVEYQSSTGEDQCIDLGRSIFERAQRYFLSAAESVPKEQRILLLQAWLSYEKKHGDAEQQKRVSDLMPQKVKKRRQVLNEQGDDVGWEEYFDYVFPDEIKVHPNYKLIQMAHLWKKKKIQSSDISADAATAHPNEGDEDSSIPKSSDGNEES